MNDSASPYLSVIIPAYNEEKRILTTLEAAYAYLTRQPYSWELLVVLDGPRDDTLGVVRRFAAGKAHIRWIDRAQNRGKGYTVREGMLAAQGAVRLFTDADNSTDISHFEQMQPLLAAGHNVVIASRDGKDATGAQQAVPQSSFKRFLGNLANLFIQLIAVPGIWDTQCGFKAFDAAAAERIFGVATVDGWAFDIEALALARRYRLRVGIIPAYWVNTDGSHVESLDYVRTLIETLKIRWNLLTGTYPR